MEVVFVILVISIIISSFLSIFLIKDEILGGSFEGVKEEIEDTVDEVKRRVERVKEEIEDVKKAGENIIEQSKDIAGAIKGDNRKGRKKKITKNYLNSLKKSEICEKVKEECNIELDIKIKKSILVNKAYTLINKR